MEYARNVLGLADAGITEYGDDPATPLVTLVSCPVPGRAEGAPRLSGKLRVRLRPESLVLGLYRQPEIDEQFACNYELNPAYQDDLESGGLRISGRGEQGEVRVIELPGHPFFLATLFLPQLNSPKAFGAPHPVILAYLRAAAHPA